MTKVYLQDGRYDKASAKVVNFENVDAGVKTPADNQLRFLQIREVLARVDEIFALNHIPQMSYIALQRGVEDVLIQQLIGVAVVRLGKFQKQLRAALEMRKLGKRLQREVAR